MEESEEEATGKADPGVKEKAGVEEGQALKERRPTYRMR